MLRRWRDEDRGPFAAMNADPRVMRHFPATLTPEESDAFRGRIEDHFVRHGFGLFAVDLDGQFIGFTGLAVPGFEAHFTPCVEIGWRLSAGHHGRGYATEAARAVLDYGFEELNLAEIVSFTVPENQASRRVMEKIGMHYDSEFAHPRLPLDHPLSRHVLYRISRDGRGGTSR